MVPRIEKTQIIFLLLVWWLSVTSFRVWVCECAWNLVETYCSCNFAPRPDGVNFYQVFFQYYMFKFTGSFVSAMIICDKFLCCYYETCRCRKAGPVQNPVGFHSENSMNWTSNDQISIPGRQENRLEALRTFKEKCAYILKRSLVNRFQTKETVFWYSGTRLARTWKPKDLRQLRLVWRCRQCITTTNWSPGRSWREG